ncbi:MAG: radical SAM protein, partial [Candidatus Hydrogenedentes bacterium]|nr:radical SAM protein [Candidatus Hydrogenedentota bacterium]
MTTKMLDKFECLDTAAILAWLREDDPERLKSLWKAADFVRKANVGDEVHLRGLIEISSYCCRLCGYCGLRADNKGLERYRMSEDEIMACARQAVDYGYGTVVMQAGEDYGITREWLAAIIRRFKAETPLAVTLSLGERPDEDLVAWREAGANRYLLRFETSDAGLYALIHPTHAGRLSDRIAILRRLRKLGYEPGSGVMVGIPGQTYVN